MVSRRSSTVVARNSVPSEAKTVGSGQNVTMVPVAGWPLRVGASPRTSSLVAGRPPLRNSMRWCLPYWYTSTRVRIDKALTTLTPTP